MRQSKLKKFARKVTPFLIMMIVLCGCFIPTTFAATEPESDGFAGDIAYPASFTSNIHDGGASMSEYEINTEAVAAQAEEAPVVMFDSVPLYFQNDYPDVPFSSGTVASSGCGITCMAMVSSYILDEEHLPDELALEYNIQGITNAERMEAAANGLGLSWEKRYVYTEMIEALEEGKICIALMNENSIFTSYGHFIVITGITDDGKIMVNDPWQPNNEYYADEFENGFELWQIVKGFSGCWVFDMNNSANTDVAEVAN